LATCKRAEAEQQHRAGLLIGTNAREWSRPFFPAANLKEGIAAQFGPLAPRRAADLRRKRWARKRARPDIRQHDGAMGYDSQFRCGTVAELIWHSRTGQIAYQFQFYRPPRRVLERRTKAKSLTYLNTFG
jgi:para-nitrobenzyl esterase